VTNFFGFKTTNIKKKKQISVEQLPNHVMGKKAKYRVCDVLNRQLPRREMARARLSVCAEVWTLAQIAEQVCVCVCVCVWVRMCLQAHVCVRV